jgi:hypothetical protein
MVLPPNITPPQFLTGGYPNVPPPVITSQPQSLTVEYGQPAVLECQASGNITYDWYRDGKYVVTGRRVEFLHIRPEHAGEYRCIVKNVEGIVLSKVATLTVDPVIVIDRQPPREFQGYKNEEMRLECSAHSSRGPVAYQWFRNRRAIRGATSEVYRAILKTRMSGSFYCQVSLRDDPGQLPMLSSSTRVSVNSIQITVQPRDIQCQTGRSVSLHCQATTITPVTTRKMIVYIWLKSDRKDGKKELLQKALSAQHSGGMLLFEQLRIDHDGYYVCQACLDKDYVESREVRLTVSMAGGE